MIYSILLNNRRLDLADIIILTSKSSVEAEKQLHN